MSDKLLRIVRFALVGGVNTLVYWGLYLLLHLFLPYMAAHVVAFSLATVGSYFLNCYFTFRIQPTLQTFLRFPLSTVPNFVITSVGMYLLVSLLGMDKRIAPLIAAVLAIPVTYVVAQFLLTGRTKAPPEVAPPSPVSHQESSS